MLAKMLYVCRREKKMRSLDQYRCLAVGSGPGDRTFCKWLSRIYTQKPEEKTVKRRWKAIHVKWSEESEWSRKMPNVCADNVVASAERNRIKTGAYMWVSYWVRQWNIREWTHLLYTGLLVGDAVPRTGRHKQFNVKRGSERISCGAREQMRGNEKWDNAHTDRHTHSSQTHSTCEKAFSRIMKNLQRVKGMNNRRMMKKQLLTEMNRLVKVTMGENKIRWKSIRLEKNNTIKLLVGRQEISRKFGNCFSKFDSREIGQERKCTVGFKDKEDLHFNRLE